MAGRVFDRKGTTLQFTAASAYTNGEEVQVGTMFGVVHEAAAIGEQVVVHIEGVFEVTALSTDVWAVGDQLYWDDGNSRWTDVSATGLIAAGKAAAAKAASATTALVRVDNAHTAAQA
jgi:predicted RecA/RadA family phage recombinase